jgi:hypothetical protein
MKTRNIREVKVGDIVQNEIGDRYKVIELLKDTFACLDCDDELRPRWIYWIAFDEANEAVWFIENKEVTEVFDGVEDIDLEKHHQNILDGLAEEDEKAKVKVGVDDSEEVELNAFDVNFIKDIFAYYSVNADGFKMLRDFRCDTSAFNERKENIIGKLNKMLKECR